MSLLPRETFERHLRRLDGGAFAAFVAAVHAARGREARVEDGDVVVETPDGTWRLRPATGRRVDATGADAVVSTGRVRIPPGVDHVPPAALYEVTMYALDRPTAATLLDSHLGLPLSVQPGGTGVASGPGRAVWTIAGVALLVVAALAAVGVAADGGQSPSVGAVAPASGGVAGAVDPAATAADAADTETGDGVGPNAVTFPPGVQSWGEVDPDALAQAHGEAVEGRSYYLRVVTSGADVFLDGEWVESWQAVRVENGTHYRQTVSGLRATGNGSEFVEFTAYADGRHEYRRTSDRPSATFRRSPVALDAAGEGVFTDRAEGYVARYLAAERTTVDVAEYDDGSGWRRVYGVVATGDPGRLALPAGATVTDYRAEATVRPDGLVETLEAQYTVRTEDGVRDVLFSMRYDDVDGHEVTAPGWLPAARVATVGAENPAECVDDTGCPGPGDDRP